MPSSTRRIRRAPLADRIKAYLNPWDFFLWLSEELNDNEWDDFLNQWATLAGFVANVIYIVARANSTLETTNSGDDVFGDYYERRGGGWLAWFASFVVHSLSLLSFVNAAYTFLRRRHYRLFEASVDITPSTPSARRVHVDSSPLSSSPLRYLSNIMRTSGAEARAHADASRDVWEVAIWDPKPFSVKLFCLFSPGHIVVYWLFLPLKALDPRPSVTVVTTIALAALLSGQLLLFQSFFTQLSKDSALIHKEVHHEYDTKFVHPSLYKPVRDVSTQTVAPGIGRTIKDVETYTPTTYVNRGFQTNPNPNYARHFGPDNTTTPRPSSQGQAGPLSVNAPNLRASTPVVDSSSPIRSGTPGALRQPQFQPSGSRTSSSTGDGGSFGIYSHVNSPLKRPPSAGGIDPLRQRGQFRREGSPLKRSSMPGGERPNGAAL